MGTMNMLLTIGLALIASAGFWATMQLIITRKGRTAEIARQYAETEKLKQSISTGEIEKRKLMADVESAALAAADSRYAHLHDDYNALTDTCKEQRTAMVALIDVLDMLVFRMRAAPDSLDQIALTVSSTEYLTARATLNDARTHLR